MNDQTSGRDAYIRGLDALSAALKADPELPLPKTGGSTTYDIEWVFFGSDPAANRTRMALVARAFGCQWREEVKATDSYSFYYLHGQLDGLHVSLCGITDEVCERVVTGSRTVEDVEWRGPLAEPSPAADVDRAIAADLDEQTDPDFRPLSTDEALLALADESTAAESMDTMAQNIRDGHIEAGRKADGTLVFRITEAGERYVENMGRDEQTGGEQ